MNLEELINKKEKVKIVGITKTKKYFISESIKNSYTIYIQNEGDYELEEIINTIQECLIIDQKQGKLIGFILSNRKFINDMKTIKEKLKNTKEYGKVQDIYLVERLKIKGKVLGLYLVDENDIGKYYLDTIEIGTYVKKVKQSNIIFKEKTVEEELGKQIRDVIQRIDINEKEISLIEEEKRQKDIIEDVIGLEIGEYITKVATIDLKQKVQKDQIKNNKQMQKNLNIANIIPQKRITKKDLNIKQELEMNDKVTDMQTLGQLLQKSNKLPQMKGKKFTKMGVIESDHIDEVINEKGKNQKANTTRYSFVAIANDGTVVPINLSKDHAEGNNPREENYQVNQKGEVAKDDVASRYKIGNGTFAIKNGKYGEIQVYHSPRKTIGGKDLEGNKSLDIQLETDNVWSIKKEERDLAGKYKTSYRSVEEGYQEAKSHEDETGQIIKGDKMRTEDIDGDEKTKSHIHDNNIDYEKLATKWGYYQSGKPNAQKAEKLFKEKRKENPNKEEKEIIDLITQELEEEIGSSINRQR